MRLHFVFLFVLGFCASSSQAMTFRPSLINGTPVPKTKLREVIRIRVGNGACTATIVGPRVILTAGHCGATGGTAKFMFDGKVYQATLTQSPGFKAEEEDENEDWFDKLFKTRKVPHDMSLGLVDGVIDGAKPITIGGPVKKGAAINLFGFGCTSKEMTGGSDGILRTGSSIISAVEANRMRSSAPLGAVLCPGDSGGPAFSPTKPARIIGVNSAVSTSFMSGSAGEISFFTRLDVKESVDFMTAYALKNKVDICGVTGPCEEPE